MLRTVAVVNDKEDAMEGFELVEYDWNEETGQSVSLYEKCVLRDSNGDPLEFETFEAHREQPAGRRHLGWRWYDGRVTAGYDEEGKIILE